MLSHSLNDSQGDRPDLTEYVTNPGHVLQPIPRFSLTVGFFKPKTEQHDVLPAGEPAVCGLLRVLPQCLFGQLPTLLNEIEE